MPLSVLPHRDALSISSASSFVDGRWASPASSPWEQRHPATNETVATLAFADAPEVDAAVDAARRAFDDGGWPAISARERARRLRAIAELVDVHADELNRLQTLDNAMPVSFSSVYQLSAEMVADTFDYHAGWIDKMTGETLPPYQNLDELALTLRDPVGVVAAILPWNAPLMLFAQKVAPALAAGCTIVLKPSEYASLAVVRLTQLLEEVELPPGVFNLVLGDGPSVGERLAANPAVDKVTFTGSRRVGARIQEVTAPNVTRLTLELGGKSPQVIFPDAPDVDLAAATAMGGVSMGLSGQGCVIMTRTLVQRTIYDRCVETARATAAAVQYGDPFDAATTSMPIINRRQLDRVMGYIRSGHEEGARCVLGGDRPSDGDLALGNWVNPTLFADVDNNMTIAQEEIFGPVLAMIPFDEEDDAIRLANDSSYGLGATVWTSDVRRALRFARAIRAGTVGVNGQTVMPNLPYGGYKRSGLGREAGKAGFEAFTELKTVTFSLSR